MLIPINDCGVGVNNNEEVVVSSLTIAEIFEKRHDTVLRDIKKLQHDIKQRQSSGSTDLWSENVPYFHKATYESRGKKYPMYILNEVAFTFLVMSYNSPRALDFKMWFINQFYDMKKQLQNLLDCRAECPQLTEQLQKIATTPFVYSNEFNMINKIVLGMSTKEFRDQHGIKKGQSIRPWLTGTQIDYMKRLQQYDTFLVREGIEYKWRQLKLADYYEELTKK